jgi:hypothetical protein
VLLCIGFGGGTPSQEIPPPPAKFTVTVTSNPAKNGAENNDVLAAATKKASQLLQCTADHFGLTALGSGLAAAGANVLRTGGKFSGATPGTSLASKTAGSLLGDLKLPFRLPTLTGFPGIGNGLRVSFTESAARFAGRAVPVVGYALLAYDAYEIGTCTVNGNE